MSLEYGKKYPVLRAYFNRKSDFPLVWSIDNGNQNNEINLASVLFWGFARSVYTGQRVNENSPVAWFEFYNSSIYKTENPDEVVIDD